MWPSWPLQPPFPLTQVKNSYVKLICICPAFASFIDLNKFSAPALAQTTNIRKPGFSSGEASACTFYIFALYLKKGNLILVQFLLYVIAARVARGAYSKSGSEVGPDGHIKSNAIAAKTGDDFHGRVGAGSISPAVDPATVPVPDDGHQNNNNNNAGGQNGGSSFNNNNGPGPAPMPVPDPTPAPAVPVPAPGPITPVSHGPKKSFQKVDAVANKDTGTAIATATNKRDTTNVQKAAASANVAIAKTKTTSQVQGE